MFHLESANSVVKTPKGIIIVFDNVEMIFNRSVHNIKNGQMYVSM